MRADRFQKAYGEDAQTSEILGIADYVIGTDDEYVYLLVLPTDVRWLENNPVSEDQYETLRAGSQEVLESFLSDNEITLNKECPNSSVFSAEKVTHDTKK